MAFSQPIKQTKPTRNWLKTDEKNFNRFVLLSSLLWDFSNFVLSIFDPIILFFSALFYLFMVIMFLLKSLNSFCLIFLLKDYNITEIL